MDSIESTEDIAKGLLPLFRTWPAFNVGDGFLRMATAFWERRVLGNTEMTPFKWSVCGKTLALLYGLSPVYFSLLLGLEYTQDGGAGGFVGDLFRSFKQWTDGRILRLYGVRTGGKKLLLNDGLREGTRDEDVEEEEAFVSEELEELKVASPVLIENLWKIYPPSIGMFGALFNGILLSVRGCLCCCRRWCSKPHAEGEGEDDGPQTKHLPKRAIRGLSLSPSKRGRSFRCWESMALERRQLSIV